MKNAVIYQIFPDRFADGDPQLTPEDAIPWGDAPTSRGFMGGDLDGIVRRRIVIVRRGGQGGGGEREGCEGLFHQDSGLKSVWT